MPFRIDAKRIYWSPVPNATSSLAAKTTIQLTLACAHPSDDNRRFANNSHST
ncbi:hypothetical protein RB5474 [Rhodopirellula baltica SH 1]|uniref:Uncharacterized protein n=1 Tax=Rhodopirellula baltica (strain DSM 10527 / NCIMB 13988 / SH1) TaxID=243090 RepID=Q7URS7_RHOBA|nr:hypothetical protein RB5474 [Rhodopirellula baltica SH 1]